VTTSTLEHCRTATSDLDFDVRRFRPSIVLDTDLVPFAEQDWVGGTLRVGDVEPVVTQPTVRCAVPLRGQPGLPRRPGHFRALTELNEAFPNHLGLYLDVTKPGVVRIGDTVEVIHP
jgi:hypothetical protein